ncbi:MAG: glycosyltransferase [Kiritimatiellales bacterium]|nr:glycosyltransferase [Kiritimatiellota bacterium]MBL7012689.1 glycosyltransferase [Kiritimatiellales bacterium]
MGPELIIWIVHLFGLLAGGYLLRALPRCAADSRRTPVSIIIPARDEERNLPTLLESLTRQTPSPEEIIVVDDGSTDRTAEIARAAGARVIASAPLPDGWRGKAWACQQGADAAVHDTLIFMDADTRFEPDGLQAVCSDFANQPGALSLAAFQTLEKPAEQLSAFFVWVMTAASELFGPFLMVSKMDYEKAGGHAAVKNKVLENVHLAAAFRNAGISVRSLSGEGTLAIRMYPGGLRELSNGWKKAFATGAGQTPPLRMAGIIFWLSTAAGAAVMLPASTVTGASLTLWGSLYAAFAGLLFVQLRRLGQFRLWTALLYPVALVFFFALFAQSASQKKQSWKGRTYVD